MPLSYVWSDNQTPQVASGVDSTLNVDVDPTTIVEPWYVTLTVTDDEGAVSVMRRHVPIDRTRVQVAALYVAGQTLGVSIPGGHSFAFLQAATGGGTIVAVACSPITPALAVFGTTTGRLYRTTGFTSADLTLVYSGFSEEVADIEWDLADPMRVWAVTRSGRVLVSYDAGLTWAVHSVLREVLAESRLVAYRMDSQPRGVASVLRVFGGDGRGEPVVAYAIVPTVGWQRVAIGGELRTDILLFADTTRYIADGTSAGRDLAVILNSAAHHPAAYYTPDMLDASLWKRATGAIDGVGKSRGRWIERDLEDGNFVMGLDDTVIYIGQITGSDAMQTWAAVAALPATHKAQHGLWLGRQVHGLSGVYLVATDVGGAGGGGLYKTTDRFASIGLVRAGGSDDFYMAAAGPAATRDPVWAQESVQGTAAAASSQNLQVNRLTKGNWEAVYNPAPSSQFPVQFTRSFNRVFFRSKGPNTGGGGQWHPGNLERSTDFGETWVEVFAMQTSGGKHWGVQGLDQAGDGRLWLCTGSDDLSVAALNSPRVYVSDDDGATWTQAYEDATQDAALDRIMSDICCHPTDPLLIYVVGGTGAGEIRHWFSDDGGVTFAAYSGGGSIDATQQRYCVMMANRRVLLVDTSSGNLRYSDDYGATWSGTIASSTVPKQLLRDKAGQVAWVIGTTPNLMRTRTFGATWETITTGLGAIDKWSMAHDFANDALYLGSASAAAEVLSIISDASDEDYGAETDFTLNVSGLFTTTIARQGIMLT